MRFLITAALVLCCSLCSAQNLGFRNPAYYDGWKSLTLKQAAHFISRDDSCDGIFLRDLTSIDKDVARELAKFRGKGLSLGMTSIDKDVAQELAKFEGEWLSIRLTSINKDVAQELVKFEGDSLWLDKLTSINKDVAQELAKFPAGLKLGLTSINKDVALELAKIKGRNLLYLMNLTYIHPDDLEILKSNPKIVGRNPNSN